MNRSFIREYIKSVTAIRYELIEDLPSDLKVSID